MAAFRILFMASVVAAANNVRRLHDSSTLTEQMQAQMQQIREEFAATTAALSTEVKQLREEVTVLKGSLEQPRAEADPCLKKSPVFGNGSNTFLYSGCNRNMLRHTTEMIETCQTGKFVIYNQNTTSNMFDMKVERDIYWNGQ